MLQSMGLVGSRIWLSDLSELNPSTVISFVSIVFFFTLNYFAHLGVYVYTYTSMCVCVHCGLRLYQLFPSIVSQLYQYLIS